MFMTILSSLKTITIHVCSYNYFWYKIYFMGEVLVLKTKASSFHAYLLYNHSEIEIIVFLFVWIVNRTIIWEMEVLGQLLDWMEIKLAVPNVRLHQVTWNHTV